MALIKSISGFRGTIGGKAGSCLSPIDIVESTAAYGQWLLDRQQSTKVVIGRDARISGDMVSALVSQTLRAMGIDVLDLGLSTTPTVECMVKELEAGGGIILTASHNPREWNALKLLNHKGEFISKSDGQAIIEKDIRHSVTFAEVDRLGSYEQVGDGLQRHIEKILQLPLVHTEAIRAQQYTIVVDAINSTGALALPMLLEKFNAHTVVINGEMNGQFAHNPEPLPKNLTQLSEAVVKNGAHLGIAVDPDVDRLVFVNQDGTHFGEEYTLVAVADYVLRHTPGPTVSNLSSTRALPDITEKHEQHYHPAAVGEVNVVEKMKEVGAVIGGEGNGGVIYPEMHYGRDALTGVALFLSLLAEQGISMTALRAQYPKYTIVKNKLPLEDLDVDEVLQKIEQHYPEAPKVRVDGLKIELPEGWIHLRKSNTEPILRIYSEGRSEETAQAFADRVFQIIK